ncbi:MAG: hypothetical protein GVY26_00210 [Bacteroidetes bacterium]|jgi:hypothetical protein|nr:hypothetical protein [Bacteroidota bacterium]
MIRLPLFIFLFLCTCLLQAQEEERSLFSQLYADLKVGLYFGEHLLIANNLEVGYRFSQRHALGLQRSSFTDIGGTVRLTARGVGPAYRYQLDKWAFSGGIGYVYRYVLMGDFIYPFEVLHSRSNPWFFRLSVQRRLTRCLHFGISYAQSGGNLTIEHTDFDVTPPERWLTERFGPKIFTINLGMLLQKRED